MIAPGIETSRDADLWCQQQLPTTGIQQGSLVSYSWTNIGPGGNPYTSGDIGPDGLSQSSASINFRWCFVHPPNFKNYKQFGTVGCQRSVPFLVSAYAAALVPRPHPALIDKERTEDASGGPSSVCEPSLGVPR